MKKFTNKAVEGVGLGLRNQHFQDFIENKPNVPWLEIHTENFFNSGATASKYLETIRHNYPLSAHCIGLSLGSASIKCEARELHLQKVKATTERLEPSLISDHLSWSASSEPHYIPDLLPIPYTDEALNIMVQNINHVQETLKHQILVENPSSYLSYKDSPITEWEFLNEVAKKSGCGILLDINNIYVSAHNHGFNAEYYLSQISVDKVQEIHLAGFEIKKVENQEVYIDTHSKPVYDQVWQLYEKAVARFKGVPTLIEWDTDVPELSVLMAEKTKADAIVNRLKNKKAA